MTGANRRHVSLTNRMEYMADSTQDPDTQYRKAKLLASGADAELRLLKSERKAEKRLAEAVASRANDEASLLRAQTRLERSREAVAAAEAMLREVQLRRAHGPTRIQD